MSTKQKYPEYQSFNLSEVSAALLEYWKENKIFERSIDERSDAPSYVFYEGPPSANGRPGIHHVVGRAIKDLFCRYHSMKGKRVLRKAGWDTHGLPIELGVEAALGIKKDDIGVKISIEDYNIECRKAVMQYTDAWLNLTEKLGYWVDMKDPYVTYENTYIESVWYLLCELYKKDLLYKGYSIQPYSPAAGTGLSSHELNQPGCYREIKDTSITAQFRLLPNESKGQSTYIPTSENEFLLAWTTTPWTLPSNTALAVGKNITYLKVESFNQYTHLPITVILARETVARYFAEDAQTDDLSSYKAGDKKIPYKVIAEIKGSELVGVRYEQLLPYAQPQDGDAFRVIHGDFVSTEDGTGVVHIAPSFGEDDFRVAKQNGIGSLTLVDLRGRFTHEVTDLAGEFVKEQYEDAEKVTDTYKSVDVRIAIKLKEQNRAFRVEKYEHSYPHCWRTDKPILYYPLDSWFIRTTAYRERMAELNKTVNWKPESTGTGRFGNWLENLVDWNLSRSRYWGVPLPIWSTEDQSEKVCIGSLEELKNEIEKSIAAGFMTKNPLARFSVGDFSRENYTKFDMHRPYVDEIFLVSPSGKKMIRETDLIDVWFDSGAMPYAQLHYPFENKDLIEQQKLFPADFIAEGVDQTRGWFYTLHALAVMLFDSVAYKAVVSNGHVLDKNGNKMSKRLGNVIDPFTLIDQFGADPVRWYMITNAQPWDSIRFNVDGVSESHRKFFSKLINTYAFFALYANIDGFTYAEDEIEYTKRPEIDRWILSVLNTLIKEVDQSYSEFEPTRAARAIERFVDEHLSNWYVRSCRRRFWKGDYSADKISAFQTLFKCLDVVSHLAAPVAPFYCDRLYCDLHAGSTQVKKDSVHLATFPESNEACIDRALEERMQLAQDISSLVLSLRTRENLKVRQPLQKIMLPVLEPTFRAKVEAVKQLILAEVNVKDIEYVTDCGGIFVKSIKPNFKALGPKLGKGMKEVAAKLQSLSQPEIARFEKDRSFEVEFEGSKVIIEISDVDIITSDIPGWLVASTGSVTVALDITVTPELRAEGLARELVNRVQNLRKESNFDVTDKIKLQIREIPVLAEAVAQFREYICSETLAVSLEFVENSGSGASAEVDLDDNTTTQIWVERVSA